MNCQDRPRECSGSLFPRGHWIMGEREFSHDASVHEVLLYDALQNLRRAGMIPDSLRVDDGDRSVNADAEAVGLGPIDERLGTNEIQFLEPPLEKFPGLQSFFLRRAFGFGLVGA